MKSIYGRMITTKSKGCSSIALLAMILVWALAGCGGPSYPSYPDFKYETVALPAGRGNITQITGYIGNSSNVNIPESIDGNLVTVIGQDAFKDCADMVSVIIPASVGSIQESAFYGCSGLTNLTLPDGLVFVGDYAFQGCPQLSVIYKGKTYQAAIVVSFSGAELWNLPSDFYNAVNGTQ